MTKTDPPYSIYTAAGDLRSAAGDPGPFTLGDPSPAIDDYFKTFAGDV
jgi:hypothetical protein